MYVYLSYINGIVTINCNRHCYLQDKHAINELLLLLLWLLCTPLYRHNVALSLKEKKKNDEQKYKIQI